MRALARGSVHAMPLPASWRLTSKSGRDFGTGMEGSVLLLRVSIVRGQQIAIVGRLCHVPRPSRDWQCSTLHPHFLSAACRSVESDHPPTFDLTSDLTVTDTYRYVKKSRDRLRDPAL